MRPAAFVLCALVVAQPVEAQQTALQSVITSQIDAFRRDDFDTAFKYAAPAIQGLSGAAERFGAMVRQGYPMVHRPAEVTYLDLDGPGVVRRQRVMIRDGAGALHILEYEMIERAGGWRINGIRILATGEVGA